MSTTTDEHGPYTSSSKLEDQAASAALYVTKDSSSKQSSQGSHPLLDENGKLSSAGAATSLKYARAQDLPSYPSAGLKLSSASAAASLAESNKYSPEYPRGPTSIPAANKAAMLAKDYEMDPLWQAEQSVAGSKAAGQAYGTKPPGAITERELGADAQRKALLAATGAMSGSRRRAGTAPSAPQGHAGWALKAATSSKIQPGNRSGEFTSGDPGFEASRLQNMSKKNVNRQMYGSAPPVAIEVEEKNRQDTLRASAIAMAQKMYAIQQTQIDQAKAAKRGDGHHGAIKAHHRALSDASSTLEDEVPASPRYQGLEEAARKLAMERLAKLRDEHAEYRNYYGQNNPPKSRMSMLGRRRASSDGQFLDDDEEQSRRIRTQMSIFTNKLQEVDTKKRQSDRDNLMAAAHRNVEARMTAMDEKVFQETGKASPHQQHLWEEEARARAQRDSDDRMVNHGKVHIGGGKYLDQAEIDAIARARLQPTLDEISDKAEKQRARDEELRLEQEKQKRDAETEKARLAEIKAEQKRTSDKEKAEEKARVAEEKRVQKEAIASEKEKLKAEAAARKEEAAAEKEKVRATAAEEKEKARVEAAAEKERARAEKEEKRKSKDTKGGGLRGILGTGGAAAAAAGAAVVGGATTIPTDHAPLPATATDAGPAVEGDTVHDQVTVEPSNEAQSTEEPVEEATDTTPTRADQGIVASDVVPTTKADDEPVSTPASGGKGDSKVRSWFKTRFRSGSKTQKEDEPSSFVSGAALTSPGVAEEAEPARSDSMRDVALAGRTTTDESEDMYAPAPKPVTAQETSQETAQETAPKATTSRSPSISSLSSSDYGEPSREALGEGSIQSDPPRGRRGFKERFLSKIQPAKEPHPNAEPTAANESSVGGGEDDVEEARDTFEEEKLAPPPKLTTGVDDVPEPAMKAVSPRGSKDRSKFTEEL